MKKIDWKQIGAKVLFGLKWFFFSYIWLFIIFLVTDIVTKQWVVSYFKTHTDPIEIIKGFLNIEYVVNDAAAFGFGIPDYIEGYAVANRVIYCVVAFIGLSLIVGAYIWKFKKINSLVKACLMLMATGALGNLIDRLFYSASFLSVMGRPIENGGGVVDWINFYGIWGFHFNIADSCVVVGTLILVVYLIVDEVKLTMAKRKQEVKESGGKVLSKEEQSRLEEEQKPEEPEKSETEE